ncbi:MAG: hypothetical protein ABGY71_03185, partial [bacterium]
MPPILLTSLLLVPSLMDGQETRPSIYPETPAGSPPVLAVEHALAATPEDMRAYEERLPGSDLRFKMLPIPG